MADRHKSHLAPVLVLMVLAGLSAPLLAQDAEPLEVPRGPFTEEQIQEIQDTMLERINFDRELEDIDPVEWDDEATVVADQFCAQALLDGTIGHYTLEGLSPLDRWGLHNGGGPYISENTCSWSWSGPTVDWTLPGVLQILDDFHDYMLAEVPPNDGHRRTLLDPHLTHVGIGIAFSNNELRYAHEFTARYMEIDETDTEVSYRDQVTIAGRVSDPDAYRLDYILLYHKDPPRPLSVGECATRMTYGLPETRSVLRPMLAEGMYYQSDRKRGEFSYDPATGEFEASFRWPRGSGWYGVLCLLAPVGSTLGENQFPGSWVFVRAE